MEKREIANIFNDPMFEGCVDGEVLPMPRAVRMTSLPDAQQIPYTIRYSDLDYNRHCNSCKYLQAMLDTYLPLELTKWQLGQPAAGSVVPDAESGTGETWCLDIHYSREVQAGGRTTIAYQDEGDMIRYQMLNSEGLTSCAAVIGKVKGEN